jgi:hypothetical protein
MSFLQIFRPPTLPSVLHHPLCLCLGHAISDAPRCLSVPCPGGQQGRSPTDVNSNRARPVLCSEGVGRSHRLPASVFLSAKWITTTAESCTRCPSCQELGVAGGDPGLVVLPLLLLFLLLLHLLFGNAGNRTQGLTLMSPSSPGFPMAVAHGCQSWASGALDCWGSDGDPGSLGSLGGLLGTCCHRQGPLGSCP